jgi:hypothetical protein
MGMIRLGRSFPYRPTPSEQLDGHFGDDAAKWAAVAQIIKRILGQDQSATKDNVAPFNSLFVEKLSSTEPLDNPLLRIDQLHHAKGVFLLCQIWPRQGAFPGRWGGIERLTTNDDPVQKLGTRSCCGQAYRHPP